MPFRDARRILRLPTSSRDCGDIRHEGIFEEGRGLLDFLAESCGLRTCRAARSDASLQLSREEIEQTSSLLENSFVLGYLRNPETKSQPPKSAEHPWNGMFFVYDRTAKELLLAKTILRSARRKKSRRKFLPSP